MFTLAQREDPSRVGDGTKFVPRIQQMLDGFRKDDPAIVKKLPVTSDLPERMCDWGFEKEATEKEKAVGDLGALAFYGLLRIGEYTVKAHRNESKQTKQFCMNDCTFWTRVHGSFKRLPRRASDKAIMAAEGLTLRLGNQKNGWKGVCIFHEANGDPRLCFVKAGARRYCHIRREGTLDDYLSSYWTNGIKKDVSDRDMRHAIKTAGVELDYPSEYGIDISRLDTHSMRSGGANQLAQAGYSEMEIQKMGRWRGDTFKEYIREELACFSEGMSKDMRHKFKFVNIAGGAKGDLHDVTNTTVDKTYNMNKSTAAAA